MQLGLAHRPLQPEQQTVVEQRRMIDAVGIPDQRVGKAGKIDEAMPVGVLLRASRDSASTPTSCLSTLAQKPPSTRQFRHSPRAAAVGRPKTEPAITLAADHRNPLDWGILLRHIWGNLKRH